MDSSQETRPSSPASLVFGILGLVCAIAAAVAGGVLLNWYADKGEGSGMIGFSFVTSAGILLVCGPLVLLGLIFSAVGLILPGYRRFAGASLLLGLLVPLGLVRGFGWAETTGRERSMKRYARGGTQYNPPVSAQSASGAVSDNQFPPTHAGYVSGVAFSADGARLVTLGSGKIGTYSQEAKVWDSATGALLQTLALTGNQFELLPDGRILETQNERNTIFNPWTGERKGPFPRLRSFGKSLGLLSATNILVRLTDGKSVVLWNLENGTEVASFSDWEWLGAPTLSPDGRTVCFHIPRKEKLMIVDGHTGRTDELVAEAFSGGKGLFSADGKLFALGGIQLPNDTPQTKTNRSANTLGGSGISAMQVFDLIARTNAVFHLKESMRQGNLVPLAFSTDKRRLIAKDEWSFVIFDLEEKSTIAHVSRKHRSAAASADAAYVLIAPEGTGSIETWDGRTGKHLGTLPSSGAHKASAFKFFGFGPNTSRVAIWDGGNRIHLCDAASTNRVQELSDPGTPPKTALLSN